MDPDEAPQNVGLHLRSKLFDIQIIYQQNIWEETIFFASFERKKYLKKLSSLQRVIQDTLMMTYDVIISNKYKTVQTLTFSKSFSHLLIAKIDVEKI